MARLLDETKHDPTEVLEVLATLEKDDRAFYDGKMERKVPVFEYDPISSQPVAIVRWQKRRVIPNEGVLRRSELLHRCEIEGADTYIEGVGWVRNGKKRERDHDHPALRGRD